MRRALLSLEACKVAECVRGCSSASSPSASSHIAIAPHPTPHDRYPFKPDQVIQNTDWELYVAQIAREILSEQSPKALFQVRNRLYELLVNAISPELVLRTLSAELLAKLDSELKHEVVAYAAFFDHRLQLGQKAIIHLEAFVARFMAIYKRYLLEMFG